MKKQLQIIPFPKSIQYGEGNYFKIKQTLTYSGNTNNKSIEKWGDIWLAPYFSMKKSEEEVDIELVLKSDFKKQQYKLEISKDKIKITYGKKNGLYYGLLTLSKLCNHYEDKLPELVIEDWPDIHKRGLLLDISRGRMPKLETLYLMIDRIALLNYNQLQLYIEGPVFNYQTINWEGKDKENLLTFEEVRLLQKYCKDRCIDLVANQNVLGHMKGWLKLPEFKSLSENPEDPNCTTLDISNPMSLTFSKQLIYEVSKCYQNKMINVNLDEPNELGKGKSEKYVAEKGKANIYLEYTRDINDYLKSLNRRMMMWADVIDTYPDLLEILPKDIILLSWGYEANHDFTKQAKKLGKWGGRFYLCPGTSSWLSFSGRMHGMLENIANAIVVAKEYGGNVLLTDWGDGGHIQHPFVSYPAYVFAGNGMWHEQAKNKVNIEEYIAKMFEDDSNKVGQIILALGNYYLYEGINVPNQTMTYGMIQMGYAYEKIYKYEDAIAIGKLIETALASGSVKQFECMGHYDDKTIRQLINSLENQTTQLKLHHDKQVKEEILNTILWIRLAIEIKAFIDNEYRMKRLVQQEKINCILQLINQIEKDYSGLWNYRNKKKGLENVTQILEQLTAVYQEKNKIINKGFIFSGLQHAKMDCQYILAIVKDRGSINCRYKKSYKKWLAQGGVKIE